MARTVNKTFTMMNATLDYIEGIRQVAACDRAKYACVLTKPDLTMVSEGYNGVASGLPNNCLRPVPGNCGCIHAETNAVASLRGSAYVGSLIAFVNGPPCEPCAMLLLRAGVCMVVYSNGYHREYEFKGTDLLDRMGIPHGKAVTMSAHLNEQGLHTPWDRETHHTNPAEYL